MGRFANGKVLSGRRVELMEEAMLLAVTLVERVMGWLWFVSPFWELGPQALTN